MYLSWAPLTSKDFIIGGFFFFLAGTTNSNAPFTWLFKCKGSIECLTPGHLRSELSSNTFEPQTGNFSKLSFLWSVLTIELARG